jgi:uncharacterized membrane protein (UPF0127 family)
MERARGLLGRPPPQPGHAMWIAPCRAVHTWGMSYPIDVAFLDQRGLVVQVAPNCAPCKAYVDRRASSVLELRAGECARLHLRAGERLTLPAPPARGVPAAAEEDATRRLLPIGAALLLFVVAWMLSGCAAGPGARAERAIRTGDARAIPELRLEAGLEYESRAWSRAEAAYRELVHREPGDEEAWLRLGTALLHLGRHAEAADAFSTLTSRGAASEDLLRALAIARTAQAAAALRMAANGSESWLIAADRVVRLLPIDVPLGQEVAASASDGATAARAPAPRASP